jgi:hypothetical protein
VYWSLRDRTSKEHPSRRSRIDNASLTFKSYRTTTEMAGHSIHEEGMGPLERGRSRYQQRNWSGAVEAFSEVRSDRSLKYFDVIRFRGSFLYSLLAEARRR